MTVANFDTVGLSGYWRFQDRKKNRADGLRQHDRS
jgi:hypothetical protein